MKNNAYTINEIKDAVIPVAHEYGVKKIALFGSYASGSATGESDVDLHLIETSDNWGYFKLCGFRQDLEDKLGVNVDVLTTGAMDSRVRDTVMQNEVLIFDR